MERDPSKRSLMKRLLSERIVFMPVCSSPSSRLQSNAYRTSGGCFDPRNDDGMDGRTRTTVGKVWALLIASVVVHLPVLQPVRAPAFSPDLPGPGEEEEDQPGRGGRELARPPARRVSGLLSGSPIRPAPLQRAQRSELTQ